jgi:ABC-2 type transport system permease protein
MSKTRLVAQREYVENLRTKSFWIGILIVPVLIAASIFLTRLLSKAKDVRTYAVLDLTDGQWLSAEIEKKVAALDLENVRRLGNKPGPQDEKRLAEIRAQWQQRFEGLPTDHPVRRLFAALTPEQRERLHGVDGEPTGVPAELLPTIAAWARDLGEADVRALKALAGELSLASYRRKLFSDLGDDPEKALNAKIDSGELFAYFVLGPDPVKDNEGCLYVSNNTTDSELRRWYGDRASDVVRERRIARLALTPKDAQWISSPLVFPEKTVEKGTGKTKDVSAEAKALGFAPVAFVYFLFIAVMTATQMLLTNTIEEKSNRIIEVLLSSVSPVQLMTGKVLGIALTGITVVASWALFAWLGAKSVPVFLPNVQLDFAAIVGDPFYLASFVAYFALGYLLYAAVLVGIGSVCSTLKEAQNLVAPVTIVLILPLIAMIPIMQSPNGTLAKVMTFIPPFTPFVMMNRAAGPPEPWEYVVSTALLVVTILIAFWAAAKVFRVGILMTGKPPRVREILRWLRAPTGIVPVRAK